MMGFDVTSVTRKDFFDGQIVVEEDAVGSDFNHFVTDLSSLKIQEDKHPAVFNDFF